MGKGKRTAMLALLLAVTALLLVVPALADAPLDAFIPEGPVVTIPDQPVPITDEAASPPTGDDSGPIILALFVGACLSLLGFTAVRNREK